MSTVLARSSCRRYLLFVKDLRSGLPSFASTSVRSCASEASEAATPIEPERPSRQQLRAHFVQSMVPMIGFGFMDNTVMIHAGNAIDLTMGVTFGLSTLSAAACGQICSDVAGVSFGGFIDAAAAKLGLPRPHFTPAQQIHPVTKRVGLVGSIIGVFCGCSLGLTNLLWIDHNESRMLKLAAGAGDGESEYQIAISNEEYDHATSIVIEGPAAKGVLASVAACLAHADLAISAIHADVTPMMGEIKTRKVVVSRDGDQVDDNELETLAKAVMAACKKPDTVCHFMRENDSLRKENEHLRARLEKLEARLESNLITITRKHSIRELGSSVDCNEPAGKHA